MRLSVKGLKGGVFGLGLFHPGAVVFVIVTGVAYYLSGLDQNVAGKDMVQKRARSIQGPATMELAQQRVGGYKRFQTVQWIQTQPENDIHLATIANIVVVIAVIGFFVQCQIDCAAQYLQGFVA
jgi:hypothetical protein